jgi:hypothetical protein
MAEKIISFFDSKIDEIFTRVGTYVQRGSKFCFVVVLLGADTLLKILPYCPISPCFQHIAPLHAPLPGSLARQPCPAALPGSLARQPCPAALPSNLARQPYPAAFHGRKMHLANTEKARAGNAVPKGSPTMNRKQWSHIKNIASARRHDLVYDDTAQ